MWRNIHAEKSTPPIVQIHFYAVLEDLVMWANRKLQAIATIYVPLALAMRRELTGALPAADNS